MPPKIQHQIINGIEYKRCIGKLCKKNNPEGVWKSLDNFGKDNQVWDKLKAICKECKNSGERKNYELNPKRMTEEELQESKIKKYVDAYIKVINGIKSKQCGVCNEWLSVESFATDGDKFYINGEQKRRYECRNCRNIKRIERKRTDPDFKIKENLRTRLYQALDGEVKSARTMELIGCTTNKLWNHLELQFKLIIN